MGLEGHLVVKTAEIKLDVFGHPLFFKHCHELLFDVDVVLEAQLDLLFTLQDLLVLIPEHDGAEAVKFGKQIDGLLVRYHCKLLEKYGADSIVELCQFYKKGGVDRNTQRELLIDSRNAVDEVS